MRMYVALLRGINVGGNRKLPMADLREIFRAAGATDVATYIQSGNVLFNAGGTAVEAIVSGVEAGIVDRFGFEVPLVVRSRDEMRAIVERHPYSELLDVKNACHVVFLRRDPVDPARLDPDWARPDRFTVHGRDVYLALVGGVAGTKLTNAYFDRATGTVSTARNWRTVTTLLDMMEAAD